MNWKCACVVVALGMAACVGGPVRSVEPTLGAEGVTYCLPRTLVELIVTVSEKQAPKGGIQFEVGLSIQPHLVADPTKEFALSRNTSSFSIDDVKVSLNPSGLLASVGTESTDASLELARGVVDAALAAVKVSALASSGAFALEDAQAPTADDAERAARQQIDEAIVRQMRPLVGTHRRFWALPSTGLLENTFADFPARGWSLKVSMTRVDMAGLVAAPSSSDGSGPDPAVPIEGIYVRGVEPYVATATVSWFLDLPADPDDSSVHKDMEIAARENELDSERTFASAQVDLDTRKTAAARVEEQRKKIAGIKTELERAKWRLDQAQVDLAAAKAKDAQTDVTKLKREVDEAKQLVIEKQAALDIEPQPKEVDIQEAESRVARAQFELDSARADVARVPQRQQDWTDRTRLTWRSAAEQLGFQSAALGLRGSFQASAETRLAVSDFAPITRVSFERALFVKSTDHVGFTDGVVTSQAWNRPSSVAAVAHFPADVLEKVISLPGEILKLRFDITKGDTELVDQQNALVSAQRGAALQRQSEEIAYWEALGRAREARITWQALAADGQDKAAIAAARTAFASAALAANSAARRIPLPVPYPEFLEP